jgi:nitrogen-specific signal transduction histidine kinase
VKKVLIILGAVFLLFIVLGMVSIVIFAIKGPALDKQSKAYVDANLPLIISNWDEQELLSRASPEFMGNSKRNDLDNFFSALSRKLGKMRSYQECKGQSYVNISPQNGKIVTAVYASKVIFENGSATITTTLIKHSDNWQIEGFDVNSDALLK